ncbi:MAG: TetR/AcrR family transcriptional repressor of nem operon [Oleispira sp.]|jgi:TetR/AcrR family transcriptional repressor of nem operon
MARPQVFNQQWVVSKAIECFWIKGYGETSLSDLLKAMSISRSTFYNTFGDKKQLFELCLAVYSQQTQQILEMTLLNDQLSGPFDETSEGKLAGALIQKLSAFAVIKQFLHIVLIAPDKDLSSRGCLLVNTLTETTKVDDKLNRLAAELILPVKLGFIHQFERVFSEQASIQHGEWLFTQLLGWRLQSQLGLSSDILEQQIDWSLFLLKDPSVLPL